MIVHHPQRLIHPEQGISVDEGIANLILWLWSEGIRTRFSCQGPMPGTGGKCGYISFTDMFEGRHAIELIHKHATQNGLTHIADMIDNTPEGHVTNDVDGNIIPMHDPDGWTTFAVRLTVMDPWQYVAYIPLEHIAQLNESVPQQ